jgi:hypothetical protein
MAIFQQLANSLFTSNHFLTSHCRIVNYHERHEAYSCSQSVRVSAHVESNSLLTLSAGIELPLYTRQIEHDRFAVRSVQVGYNDVQFIPSRMFCHGGCVS